VTLTYKLVVSVELCCKLGSVCMLNDELSNQYCVWVVLIVQAA